MNKESLGVGYILPFLIGVLIGAWIIMDEKQTIIENIEVCNYLN